MQFDFSSGGKILGSPPPVARIRAPRAVVGGGGGSIRAAGRQGRRGARGRPSIGAPDGHGPAGSPRHARCQEESAASPQTPIFVVLCAWMGVRPWRESKTLPDMRANPRGRACFAHRLANVGSRHGPRMRLCPRATRTSPPHPGLFPPREESGLRDQVRAIILGLKGPAVGRYDKTWPGPSCRAPRGAGSVLSRVAPRRGGRAGSPRAARVLCARDRRPRAR